MRILKKLFNKIRKDESLEGSKKLDYHSKQTFQKNSKNLENFPIKSTQLQDDLQYVFNHLHVGIWIRETMESEMIFVSKGMEKITQRSLESLYREPDYWKDMILPDDREEVFNRYRLLNKGQMVQHQYRIKDGNGTTKWIYEQTIPVINNNHQVVYLFGVVTDVSPKIELLKKVEFLMTNDPVTTLPNMYSCYQKIDELIKSNKNSSFALLYIDIDNFSWINDYLGHKIGDIVLKRLSSRLISKLPEEGYLAKMENDAFIMILSCTNNKDRIFRFAEMLTQLVREKITIEEYELHVTASIGISFYPENGHSNLRILENAHTALRHAKRLGKNNFQIYSFDRDISAHKKYMLEKDLRKAIANEEFEVYYQPQINPNNNAVVSAEALIRWNHEKWGIVSPEEFIPIAEEKHLIHLIGDWVIETVLHQMKTWQKQGYPLCPVSINISPVRFLRTGLENVIKKALDKYQVQAKYLQIEITEGSLLKFEENIMDTLKALKKLGVTIILDDFGTGYSSFHYLQKIDCDILKIDQSFIHNLISEEETETKEAAIVSSLLHLAKGLNMKVVAEGVEEYNQLEFLKQKQCDIIQGYLYSEPVPLDQFEQILQKRIIKPKRQKATVKPEQERRKYFRFYFSTLLPAKMRITEVHHRKINIGAATILIENISIGGIRFLSSLKLPVISNMKLSFQFNIMNQYFDLDGSLVYKNEESKNIYAYGVSFQITEREKDKLAEIINKMTIMKRLNQAIPDTKFIEENPYSFLRKKLL